MPIRRRYLSLVAVTLAGWVLLPAQDEALDLDWSLFREPGGDSRLEVYLGIPTTHFTAARGEQLAGGRVTGLVMLKKRRQITVFREFTVANLWARDELSVQGNVARQAEFILSPGEYQLQVVMEDNTGRQLERSIDVTVPAYKAAALAISDVQLAHRVRRGAAVGDYAKRGLSVWPHAGVTYGLGRPLLWYYAEVYGLAPGDTVESRAALWQDTVRVITLDPKSSQASGVSSTEWGAIDISALPAGGYQLTIAVTVGGETARSVKPLQLVSAAAVPDTADTTDVLTNLEDSELATLVRALIRLGPPAKAARPLADNVDADRLQLRDQAERLAAVQDRDPSDYLAQLVLVWPQVVRYELGRRAGARLTPQGKVMLAYGLPASVATHPATTLLREYHVWDYPATDTARQVVFMDRQGSGRLSLVHNGLPGGESHAHWARELPWIAPPVDTVATPVEEPELPPAAPAPVDTLAVALPDTTAPVDTLPVALPDTTAPVDTAQTNR